MKKKDLEQKFQTYYLEFRTSMYWYVRKKLNSDDVAEDLTSDLFIKLLEHSDIIEDRDINGVKAWLYTVARNMVIDYYRRSNKREGDKIEMEEEFFEIISSEESSYLDDEIRDEEALLVKASLDILSEIEKELINLRFKEELKFNEIADILGKKEGAIKMQLYRALEKLKEHLGDRIDVEEDLES